MALWVILKDALRAAHGGVDVAFDCVQQRGKPAIGPGDGSSRGDRDPYRTGSKPDTADTAALGRKPSAIHSGLCRWLHICLFLLERSRGDYSARQDPAGGGDRIR